MIKTHKPRGHFWVGASAFQRSKEIRKITFEDCTPPGDEEVLYPDSDEDRNTNEKSAKRRRIEQLADDFLNGKPLIIQSARPHHQSLKVAIEYNERSRTGKTYALDVTREKAVEGGAIWEDVDELATPARPAQVERSKTKGNRAVPGKQVRAASKPPTIEAEQASSACRQVRDRDVKLTLEPSTAAKKQAAALRHRGLRRAATEAPAVAEVVDESTPETVPHSDSTTVRPRYFRNRKPPSTEWLLRQNTALYELKADESFDELTRSPLDGTPSRPSQKPKAEYISVPGEDSDQKGVSEPCSTDDLAKSQGQALQRTVAVPEVVHEHSGNGDVDGGLAVSKSTVQQDALQTESTGHVKGDDDLDHEASQVQATNTAESRCTRSKKADGLRSIQSDEGIQHTTPPVAATRPAYTTLASSNENGTPFMFRKRRTRANPNGDLDASTAPRTKRAGPGKNKSQPQEKHPVPAKDSPTAPTDAPPILDMSISHDSSFGMRLNMALVDEHTNAILPAEPSTDGRTSSVKKALRKEMRDAGADISVVEGEPQSSQAEAIPQRCERDDNGSQTECGGQTEDGVSPQNTGPADEAAITQWPGTQMALYQAQRELFPSPAKALDPGADAGHLTPGPSNFPPASAPPTNPPIRPPLRELSQEQQLPSTQALMGAWSPWSAVKKTKNDVTDMTIPSPSAPPLGSGKAAKSSRLSIINSEPTTSFLRGSDRRRSSLRFSMTSESLSTPRMQFQVTKSASQEASREKTQDEAVLEHSTTPTNTVGGSNHPSSHIGHPRSSGPSLTSILREHLATGEASPSHMPHSQDPTTIVDTTIMNQQTRDDSTTTPCASFTGPAGQAQALSLSRDDSQPEKTIADLSEDLFGGVREMEGIASQ